MSWTDKITMWHTLFELKEDNKKIGLKGDIFFAYDFAIDLNSGGLKTLITYAAFNEMGLGKGNCSFIVTNEQLEEKFILIEKTFIELKKEMEEELYINKKEERGKSNEDIFCTNG